MVHLKTLIFKSPTLNFKRLWEDLKNPSESGGEREKKRERERVHKKIRERGWLVCSSWTHIYTRMKNNDSFLPLYIWEVRKANKYVGQCPYKQTSIITSRLTHVEHYTPRVHDKLQGDVIHKWGFKCKGALWVVSNAPTSLQKFH